MADGRLLAEAHITRVGIFEYRMHDGTIRRELRDYSEVHDAKSLESFGQVYVTNDHPRDGSDVTIWNSKEHMVGATGERVTADGDFVRASLMIGEVGAIDAVDQGRVEVSCGYTCDTVEEPGTHPRWGYYDAKQINIRGNHVAIVDRGRAGPEARIRLDDASSTSKAHTMRVDGRDVILAVQTSGLDSAKPSGDSAITPYRGKAMTKTDEEENKIMLEKAAEVASLATKRADAADAKLEAERQRADAAVGRADGLAAEVERLKKNRLDEAEIKTRDEKIGDLTREVARLKARADKAEDPKRLAEAVARRTFINRHATLVLGEKNVLDSASNREIMCAVVERLHNVTIDKDKSDDYVQARFDAAIAGHATTSEALEELRDMTRDDRESARIDSAGGSLSARDKYIQKQQTAWKESTQKGGN